MADKGWVEALPGRLPRVMKAKTILKEQSSSVRKQLSPVQAIAVIAIGGIVIAGLAVPYTDWWREDKYQSLSLETLEKEKASSSDPILLYWLGKRLNEQGKYSEAATILEKAAQIDPASARIRDAWAQSSLASGRAGEAFAQLKQFASMYPNNAQAHLLLGKLHVTLGADELAESTLKEALRLNPKLADAWALLGDVYQRGEQTQEAVNALHKSLEINPNRAASYATLGAVLRKNDPKAAEDALGRAVTLEPKDTSYRRELADLLLRQGKFTEAEAEARETLQQSPEDGAALLVLGRCLLERNATSEARAPLETAAELAPFDPVPAQNLQRLYTRLGDTAKTSEWAKQYQERQAVATEGRRLSDALLKDRLDKDLNRQMARYQAKLGKVEDCIHHMAIALGTRLDAPEVLLSAGQDLKATNHPQEARTLARQVLERDPSNTVAQFLLR